MAEIPRAKFDLLLKLICIYCFQASQSQILSFPFLPKISMSLPIFLPNHNPTKIPEVLQIKTSIIT